MIYKLYKTTYLDKFNKCYKNIITINKNPNDPLLNNVLKQVSRQKLSPFEGFDCCSNQPSKNNSVRIKKEGFFFYSSIVVIILTPFSFILSQPVDRLMGYMLIYNLLV